MKLSKIAKLCVRAKRLYLYDDPERGIQWVGDGRSMYPLYMMPELTTETVLRVLDVKDKDFDNLAVSKADLPSHIDCSDGTDDKLLPEAGISIVYASDVLEPLRLASGLRFLNPSYLAPVQDKPDLMLYERETATGEPYIVAKVGLMVQAIIQPLSVTDDKLLEQLETLARELQQMMQTDRETDATDADIAPVRRGHWIQGNGCQICSECGEEHEWDEYRAAYCDVCGAKMEVDNG